jgi:hypothetical protein
MMCAYVSKPYVAGAPGASVDVTFDPEPDTPSYAVVEHSPDLVNWTKLDNGKIYTALTVESITTPEQYVRVNYYGGVGYLMVDFGAGTILPGPIATLSLTNGGTLYGDGSYTSVPLTGGTGSGATADMTVAGGIVTGATLTGGGAGYTVGDTLSADDANLGGLGTGSGLVITVDSVA